jgi:hypothetical protein
MIHAIGSPMSRIGNVRIAATVPPSTPVGVVNRDQERRLERRALEQRLQVSEQPEALLGQRVKSGELAGVE